MRVRKVLPREPLSRTLDSFDRFNFFNVKITGLCRLRIGIPSLGELTKPTDRHTFGYRVRYRPEDSR